MIKKWVIRMTVFSIIASLLLFTMIACGPDSEKEQTTTADTSNKTTTSGHETEDASPDYLNLDSTLPIVKDGHAVTLTCACVPRAGFTQNPEDHWVWAFWEKYGNVEIEPMYYQEAAWQEKRTLLFASGEMPDFFIYCPWTPSDMVQYGQDEGLFLPLEDLISEYAPIIEEKMKEPELEDSFMQSFAPDGHMYSIPNVKQDWLEINTPKFFIRKDWLQKGGYEMPSTLDDLTEVLTYFRDGDPNESGKDDVIPWIGSASAPGYTSFTYLLTALGMNSDSSYEPYVKPDRKTVSFPVLEDNYIHYLQYAKKYLEEGLLNSDLYTMTLDRKNAMIEQLLVGLAEMGPPYVLVGNNPEEYNLFEHVKPLTSDYNSQRMWTITDTTEQGGIVVSKDTEYPEVIVRMAQILFDHDGKLPMSLLFWVGPLDCEGGVDYECPYKVDGYGSILYKFEDESWTPYPSDGTDIWTYINNNVSPTVNAPLGLMYKETEVGELFGKPQVLPEFEMSWRDSLYENIAPYQQLKIPILFLGVEEHNRIKEIAQPIVEYIRTSEAEFITGNTPVTESEIERVRSELETLGIEEYLQIIQEAYDAFLSVK